LAASAPTCTILHLSALRQHVIARPPPSRWLRPSGGGNVIAIPESASVAHVKENAVALSLTLTPQELQTLDAVHSAPGR